jgi:ABC-type Fe3+/spermidine/putrescine transport system ATPase subunit
MSTAPALLEIDIQVARRNVVVEASFALKPGERLAIFGTSGAGKTTILESVAGLVRLSRGKVRVENKLVAGKAPGEAALAPRERQVALVRQPTTLFPHLTVEENVAYALRHSHGRAEVTELLERLGLSALARARGAALSGGQRQRVALGRALASGFRVLLLDEPLSAIDVAAREPLRLLVVETLSSHDAAGILVTHDLAEAQAFGEQLGIIDNGRLLQMGGSREVVLSPCSRRVAELVGYAGFVPHPAREGSSWAIHPDRVVHGCLPERGVVLEATVLSTRPFGPRYECTVATGSGEQFSIHLDAPPARGTTTSFTAIDPPLLGA